MSAPLKLGADIWNHHTDWPAFKAAQLRAEALGYDSLWAPDHIYPPDGPIDGPILEPYMLMAPIAALTSRATVGLMVSANTYRNPALLTKMVTTLDHLSGGRAILGIGSAWSEPEHRGFGFEFGDNPAERLRWLREALPVIRGMLDGTRPSAAGDHYHMVGAINEPPPIQRRLPILIGGSGRRVTLRLVAEYVTSATSGAARPTSPRRMRHWSSTARSSGATRARSNAASMSVCQRSATRARTRSVTVAPCSRVGHRTWRISRSARPRRSSSGWLDMSRWATAISSSTSPHPMIERR